MPDYDEAGRLIFRPDGKVLRAYMADEREVAVIRGPLGSGTSSTSCVKLLRFMARMPPCRDGVRRSRWIVVRNTYTQLRDTTLPTWRKWVPESAYGQIKMSRPMIHEIRVGDIEADVFFIALDSAEDVEKLRSLEITGGWFNEIEFVPYVLFVEAKSRCRYPAVDDVDGKPFWRGMIADMNAPGEDHWLPQMTGEVPYPEETPPERRVRWPDVWGYHVQPAALIEVKGADGKVQGYSVNPKAENLKWLPVGYYLDNVRGNSRDWIRSRLMNEIVTVVDGDPVWPAFSRDTHTTMSALPFVPEYDVWVSLDFGRRPTALIAQEVNHRVQVQHEFRLYGVGAATFAPALKRYLTERYQGAKIRFTGDPKGQDRGQADERTAYEIFAAHGMVVMPSPVKQNLESTRLEIVSSALEYSPGGHSRILISTPGCPTLVGGMAGKYHFKKLMTGEAEVVKDKWSDPCDCLGYLLAALGDGRRMIGLDAAAAARAMKVSRPMRSLRRVG